MGAAYFYHLTARPLEATLPMLLGRARQAGWRVCLRGTDPARLEALDLALWSNEPDPFLPHGLSGGAFDAEQPVLLTCDTAIANAAECLMCVDGAAATADEVRALERVCILFDGNDASALDKARDQWRALTGAGCAAQYWAESSGRWEKRAER